MAFAFDAVSQPTQGTGNLSWTHTPVGTPRGVLVFIVSNDDPATGGKVDSVTYDGTTMTEVTGSPLSKIAGEDATTQAWFLGTGIGTGAVTVSAAVTGSSTKDGMCVTVTADADTEINAINVSLNSPNDNDPTGTLALSGVTSFVAEGYFSGITANTGSTASTGWTKRYGSDYATPNSNGFHTFDTVGSTDVTIGYSNSLAEDVTLIAVAINEIAGGGGLSIPVAMHHYARMRNN